MRTIPIALQADLDRGVTTHCQLLRIVPRTPGYAPIGLCSTNVDITYDDGAGPLTYRAAVGVELSNASSTSDMAVDNAEGTALLPAFDVAVSEEALGSGAYDNAEWYAYQVDYLDLSKGHILLGRGQLGQVRVVDGTSFVFETLGLTQQLKQTIVEGDSLRCRARFGSQPLGTPGADVTERFPCGYDTSGLWVPATVTAVDVDSVRVFAAAGLGQAAGFFQPGLLRWLAGRNAGRVSEVEVHGAGGLLELAFPVPFALEVGDEFEVRPDCTKWHTGANSCRAWWGTQWVLHYRGEPYIPVADINQINVPATT